MSIIFFERTSEDRRVHIRPIAAGGLDKPVHAGGVDGNGGGVGKNPSVESRNPAPEGGRISAFVHLPPKSREAVGNLAGIFLDLHQQIRERLLRQKADIFCVHREEATDQKIRDRIGRWSCIWLQPTILIKFSRKFAKLLGKIAGNHRLASGGVERTGAVPDSLKNIPDGSVSQIFQPVRVRPVPDRERLVRPGCIAKVVIELKKIADIRDDDDRRNVLGIGQLTGVLFSLLFGIIQFLRQPGLPRTIRLVFLRTSAERLARRFGVVPATSSRLASPDSLVPCLASRIKQSRR